MISLDTDFSALFCHLDLALALNDKTARGPTRAVKSWILMIFGFGNHRPGPTMRRSRDKQEGSFAADEQLPAVVSTEIL